MNYGRGYQNPHRNSWIPARPVLPEYGVGRNLGETPGRPIVVDDESWVRAPVNGNASWTPVTPGKPIPARSNLIPAENQPENKNWEDLVGIYQELLKEETPNLNVVPDLYPKFQNNRNQNRVASSVQNLNPVLNSGPLNPSPGTKYFPSDDPAKWDSGLLAAMVRPNRSSTRGPFIGPKTNTVHRTTVPKSSFATSKGSSGYSSKQIPIDGFPIPYRPCYDLNSPPRSELEAASSGITSPFLFAPVTPNTQQPQRVPENNSCENQRNDDMVAVGESTSSAVSTTRKEHLEGDETGFDLNKTPQQKTPARRKKHRPKVIREGKVKKTPNPKEPKNDTRVKRKYVRKKDVNGVPQSSGKRKYVRKKGVENADIQQVEPSVENPVKTCKKKLNFDMERVKKDERQEKGINLNVDPQEIEQNNNYLGVNSHLESSVNCIRSGTHTHNARNHALNVLARNLTMRKESFVQMNRYDSLDERRGVKRQSFEQMSNRNLNAMDSLLMYQKMLEAGNGKDLADVLFESQKKAKTQSDLHAFEGNSRGEGREKNGGYGNVSAMELLNSCSGRMSQGYRRFEPPVGARQSLQNRQVPSGVQPSHGIRPVTAMVRWNMPAATPPKDYSRPAVVDKKQPAMPNWSNQRLNGGNRIEVHQQSFKKTRGGARKTKFEVAVEDITSRLEAMCIYDEKEKGQNALVPYRGNNNAIVPFEPIKKRKPRAKVDLDPETDRLWRLLMGKEGSEGTETLDKDKEKWWENERRVFRGRADSFIARMHLVQGDRRFSRWKGSVVDSVIGVFLTQNVSDHLSSSAFMSLAAKFAINKTHCQDRSCVLVEEPINKILPKEQISGNIGRQPLFNQTSFVSHISSAENKQNRREEEAILSQDSLESSTIQTVDEIRSSSASNSEPEDHEPGRAEKVSLFRDLFSSDNWNMPLNSQFNTRVPKMPSLNSGMTEAYHTSNLAYQQNEMTGFQYDFLRNNPTRQESFQFQPGPQTAENGAQKEYPCAEDRVSGVNKQNGVENAAAEANSKEKNGSNEPLSGVRTNGLKGTVEDEKKKEFDWDSLRKDVFLSGGKRERSKGAKDSIDYEALRRAHVNEISDAIRERGMNNLLADRIKGFLDRLVKDHGSIDLEWLRDVPPEKAKDYLLSIRGLGLKSVECVRLLTLHHLAFPVDTNVGRIAVRLGWVPLQPLPESLQLHLLEMYPVLESIQKYLWPRLCKLDQLTLYELHYQMITFGKVFCTKSKPNCNACPMRAECRHFASAFASARLSLPGPEEKRIVTSDASTGTNTNPPVISRPMSLPPAETIYAKDGGFLERQCEPIIEEPTTPEPELAELSISDIEDQYYDDDDEIPTIKLDMEEFTTNLQKMQDGDMSKALVALNPQAASIPTPKLKNVSRLRTEHQVYELPDSHPVLEGLDKREPDDPSPYLLAIWTPGETATSIQPPERGCEAQESGKLCDRTTCFSCNCIKEANSQVVRGTILMPCRTAMRGSFPLNGTYFQVNEMFADHASSLNPIDVPRSWIWNLPRRTVYFGTSVSTIFKGLTTEEIQYCFWRGFVCVRGFDQKTRAPRPLMARLHFPASKLVKTKNDSK